MSAAVTEVINLDAANEKARESGQKSVKQIPIQQDPDKLGGHPTIGAARVQADVLINYLASGSTIDEFLADYDAVSKDDVLAVLAVVKQAMLDGMLTGVRLRDENTF